VIAPVSVIKRATAFTTRDASEIKEAACPILRRARHFQENRGSRFLPRVLRRSSWVVMFRGGLTVGFAG